MKGECKYWLVALELYINVVEKYVYDWLEIVQLIHLGEFYDLMIF